MPDGCVELQTSVSLSSHKILTYYVDGSTYWRMLHDDEEPYDEYAGRLEALLASVRTVAGFHEAWPPMSDEPGEDRDGPVPVSPTLAVSSGGPKSPINGVRPSEPVPAGFQGAPSR